MHKTRFTKKLLLVLGLTSLVYSCSPEVIYIEKEPEYTIYLNANGGWVNPSTITVKKGEHFDLPTPTKNNYVFQNWVDENENVFQSGYWTFEHDMKLTATYSPKDMDLGVGTWQSTIGHVTQTGHGYYGETITIEAFVDDESYSFDRWVDIDHNTITKLNPYTFECKEYQLRFLAQFKKNDEIKDWNEEHGVIPSMVNGKIKFGMYPQSILHDTGIIKDLETMPVDDNGYVFYEDEYYKSIISSSSKYAFMDNGQLMQSKRKYWFKVEPLYWLIMDTNSDGTYKCIAEKPFDCFSFGTSNNYANSSIRARLNGELHDKIFGSNEKYISTVTVDNSFQTVQYTTSEKNKYICENTIDKVYLPSYQEMNTGIFYPGTAVSVYFSNRIGVSTEYARARGASVYYASKEPEFGERVHNVEYWTRSPCDYYERYVNIVDTSGILYKRTEDVTRSDTCIRPIINVLLTV